MAGGSFDIDLAARSEYIAWVEGLANPWVPVVAWLEHLNPQAKPQDPKKLITVMVALRFRDSGLNNPTLDRWLQAIVISNQTSSSQKLRLHFIAGDGSGELRVSEGEVTALDNA